MRKKFLFNLAFLLGLNLLVKPFWILGVDRQVQNVVGTQEYGFYFAIFNFSYLFFILLDLGISNYNNRNIARNNHHLKTSFGGIATLKLLLGVFYAIIVVVIGRLIGYNPRQMHLLLWVGFNQFLLSFILYLRSNLSGLLLFKTDSLISILDRLLMIGIVGVLLWTGIARGRFTIEWFVYAQTVAYSLTFLTALVAVLRKSGKLKLVWDGYFFLRILKRSLPFALLVLIMSFYSRMDSVLIERLLPSPLGEQQAGVYAQAYRLLDAGQNMAYLFAVLLLPLFSKMIKERQAVNELVKLSFSILMTFALLVAVSTQFFASDMMRLMYSQHPGETLAAFDLRMEQSAHIFRLLMWSLVAISSNYIFGTLLTANNSLKVLNWIAFSGLIINLVLNIILIPVHQAEGSAAASLITQLLTAILQIVLAVRYFRFKPDYRWLIRMLFVISGVALMGVLQQFIPDLSWEIRFVIVFVVGLILAVVLKTLNLKDLLIIIREREEI